MTRRQVNAAAVACGAGVAAAVTLAAVAARHADPAEVSPVVPAGDWNTVWIAGLLAALALYGLGALAAAHSRVRLAVVVGLSVAVQAIPLVAPVLLSKDLYAYWGQARLVLVHGANPYRSVPDDYPQDPALPYVSEQWRGSGAPYGPVWEALALPAAAAAGTSPSRAGLAYRLLALAGILAAVGLVARGTGRPSAVAFIGWNPLIAIHYGGGGHNDAWMAALLVVAVCWRNRAKAGAAWPLASGFKAIPVVLLPLELARTRFHAPRRPRIAFAATAVAIAVAATVAFGSDWITAPFAALHQSSPLGAVNWLMRSGLRHREAAAAALLLFAAIYTGLLVLAWRTGRARLSVATSALVLCTAARPWYVLWPTALAAAEEDPAAAVIAYLLTAYFLVADAIAL